MILHRMYQSHACYRYKYCGCFFLQEVPKSLNVSNHWTEMWNIVWWNEKWNGMVYKCTQLQLTQGNILSLIQQLETPKV